MARNQILLVGLLDGLELVPGNCGEFITPRTVSFGVLEEVERNEERLSRALSVLIEMKVSSSIAGNTD
ncbi:MAG TPA: hypothetical protein VMG82_37435 [Candidatus Sulfotelmatobacter sp.]|nr:hypothetical protein [Candidatus Sulfotelmatobacter sp.]